MYLLCRNSLNYHVFHKHDIGLQDTRGNQALRVVVLFFFFRFLDFQRYRETIDNIVFGLRISGGFDFYNVRVI